MKLCRLNIPKDNSIFSTSEPDEHYDDRRTVLVLDDYDFSDNNDEDISNDPCSWHKHWKRLRINYYDALRIIRNLLSLELNPNYPTIDMSGLATMDDEHKKLAVEYCCIYPRSLRVGEEDWQSETLEDVKATWKNIIIQSKTGRFEKVEEMRNLMGDTLDSLELDISENQKYFVDVEDMISRYISTSNPQFKAWLNSDVDTGISGEDYTNTGFASKSYYIEEKKEQLIEIIEGTHYLKGIVL